MGAAELLAHAQARAEQSRDGDDASRARAARELEFAGVYSDHERLLGERGAVDAGDLVLRAFRLLHERPHVRERTARRFGHVLVDEYQDVNFAQATLLGLLGEEHREVTVAGDPEAAIHRYGGRRREEPRRLPVGVRPRDRGGASARRMRSPSQVRFWRCASERAQAQAVAAEAERLIAVGASPARIGVLVRSVESEGAVVASALEERAVPFTLTGPAAYFQRAEVRDVLAWLRVLADPSDAGAAVRALSRPPIEIHSVDVARLTQLARRRKLDLPAAVAAALEGPQLTPEGRDRAQAFLRLYRAASGRLREPPPGPLRAAADRAHRRAPPAGVRHPGRHRRAAAQHRAPARAGHRVRAPRAGRHRAGLHPLPQGGRRLGAARAGGRGAQPGHTGRARAGLRRRRRASSSTTPSSSGSPRRACPGATPGPPPTSPPSCSRSCCPPTTAGTRPPCAACWGWRCRGRREGMVLAWAEGQNGSPARPSPFYLEALEADGRRGGGGRGGAVRPGRGPALHLPHHARRAAGHRGAHRRPPGRDAPRHRAWTCPTPSRATSS